MAKLYPSQQAPRITVIVTPKLKNWFKRYAVKKNKTQSEIVIAELEKLRAKDK